MPALKLRAMKAVALASAAAFVLSDAAAQLAPPTAVEETPLARDAFATGTLSRADGALEGRLWRDADPALIGYLLEHTPARPAGPALGEALRRVLLSNGDTPEGATPSLGGRKLLALARAGYVDEARTIASLSTAPRTDQWVARALAVGDLLEGLTADACKRNANLTAGRDSAFWVKLRLLCYATTGEGDAADLTLTLLREQGSLDDTDVALFNALASGAPQQAGVAPENALHLAAIRQLGLPLSPALLDAADSGVLKAVAEDARLDPATRIAAANRAASMGVIKPAALQVLYAGVELEDADIARAAEIANERPNDPLADVLLFKAVQSMAAPEFLRDKAARIAQALGVADSFPRAYAASVLYADEIVALEGALLPPEESARFSLARMAVGDGDGAARWLFSMMSGGAASLDEAAASQMKDLANLLAVLDPISAAAVAEAAGIELAAPAARGAASLEATADNRALARFTDAAFDAAIDDIPGQAALAGLAASGVAAPGDPVARAVISQSMRAAGLSELRRRMEFESAWKARFVTAPAAAPGLAAPPGAVAPGTQQPPQQAVGVTPTAASAEERGFAPRLKPRSTP